MENTQQGSRSTRRLLACAAAISGRRTSLLRVGCVYGGMLNAWRWGRWSLEMLLVDYFAETPQWNVESTAWKL